MQLTTKKPAQVTDNFFLVISFIKLFFFLNRSTIFTGRRFNIHARCKVFVILQTICKSFISVVTKILHCTSNLLTWMKIVPSYILLINEFHGEVLRSNVSGLQMDPFFRAGSMISGALERTRHYGLFFFYLYNVIKDIVVLMIYVKFFTNIMDSTN